MAKCPCSIFLVVPLLLQLLTIVCSSSGEDVLTYDPCKLMEDTLKQLPRGLYCSVTDSCKGIACRDSVKGMPYSASVEVSPCSSPVSANLWLSIPLLYRQPFTKTLTDQALIEIPELEMGMEKVGQIAMMMKAHIRSDRVTAPGKNIVTLSAQGKSRLQMLGLTFYPKTWQILTTIRIVYPSCDIMTATTMPPVITTNYGLVSTNNGDNGNINTNSGDNSDINTINGDINTVNSDMNTDNGDINTDNGDNSDNGDIYTDNGDMSTDNDDNIDNGDINANNIDNTDNGDINTDNVDNTDNGGINTNYGTITRDNGDNTDNGGINAKNGTINRYNGDINTDNGKINRDNGTNNNENYANSGRINANDGTSNDNIDNASTEGESKIIINNGNGGIHNTDNDNINASTSDRHPDTSALFADSRKIIADGRTNVNNSDFGIGNDDIGNGQLGTVIDNINMYNGNIGSDALNIDDSNIGRDNGDISPDDGNIDVDNGDIGVDNGTISTDDGNIGVDNDNIDIDNDGIGVNNGGVGVDNVTINKDGGNIGVDNSDTGVNNNDIVVDNDDIDIDNGGIGVNNSDIDVDNSDISVANGEIGVDNSDIGVDNVDIRVSNGDIGVDNSDSGIAKGDILVGKDDDNIVVDGSNIGADNSDISTDDDNTDVDNGDIRVDNGDIDVDNGSIYVNNGNIGVDNRDFNTDSDHIGIDKDNYGLDNGQLNIDNAGLGMDNDNIGIDNDKFTNMGSDHSNLDSSSTYNGGESSFISVGDGADVEVEVEEVKPSYVYRLEDRARVVTNRTVTLPHAQSVTLPPYCVLAGPDGYSHDPICRQDQIITNQIMLYSENPFERTKSSSSASVCMKNCTIINIELISSNGTIINVTDAAQPITINLGYIQPTSYITKSDVDGEQKEIHRVPVYHKLYPGDIKIMSTEGFGIIMKVQHLGEDATVNEQFTIIGRNKYPPKLVSPVSEQEYDFVITAPDRVGNTSDYVINERHVQWDLESVLYVAVVRVVDLADYSNSSSDSLLVGNYTFAPSFTSLVNGVDYIVEDVVAATCLYYDELEGDWKGRGCQVGESSRVDKLLCQCNHLTSFTATTYLLAISSEPQGGVELSLFPAVVLAATVSIIVVLLMAAVYVRTQKAAASPNSSNLRDKLAEASAILESMAGYKSPMVETPVVKLKPGECGKECRKDRENESDSPPVIVRQLSTVSSVVEGSQVKVDYHSSSTASLQGYVRDDCVTSIMSPLPGQVELMDALDEVDGDEQQVHSCSSDKYRVIPRDIDVDSLSDLDVNNPRAATRQPPSVTSQLSHRNTRNRGSFKKYLTNNDYCTPHHL